MRAVGILIAVLFIAGGLHEFHPRPVRIELIRHDARQRRPAPASHFRAMRDDVRSSVLAIDTDGTAYIIERCAMMYAVPSVSIARYTFGRNAALVMPSEAVAFAAAPNNSSGIKRTLSTNAPAPSMPLRNPRRLLNNSWLRLEMFSM